MSSAAAYDRLANAIRQSGQEQPGAVPDIGEMLRLAVLAASSHNTQPWKFVVGSASVTILPDYARRCPVVDPDDAHLFKSLGCAAENLVLAAAAQGFAAEPHVDARRDRIDIQLRPDAAARAGELYRAITRRQCVRTAYDGRPLEAPALAKLTQAGAGPGVRTLMLTSPEQKAAVSEFVRRGNLMQLTDRAFRRELLSWIRFNPAAAIRHGDGLAGRASGQPGLPDGLGSLLAGLILSARRQAARDAAHIRSSAGIAVIVSTGNDKAAWFEAGRAGQRFTLQATALEIRTAFINQPIEVPLLRDEFAHWLKLDGRHAALVLRFGHGPTMPFSLRRPLDTVIVADAGCGPDGVSGNAG